MRESSQNNILDLLQQSIVEALLPPEAAAQLSTGAIGNEFLLPAAGRIRTLSELYTSRTAGSPPLPEFSHADASAYALYYLPINFFKLRTLLLDLPSSYLSRQFTVLDYGCGPGTATLAAQSVLSGECRYTCIDSSPEMLKVAEKIQSRSPWPSAQVDFIRGSKIPDGQFNIVIAANVVSEIGMGPGLELVEVFRERLANKGVLILLEPGTLSITRDLMVLRDLILSRFKDLVVRFPCTRCGNCPMLSSSGTDWCHASTGWNEPSLIRQLDALTDFNKHRMKFSAFVFIRNGEMRKGYRVLRPAGKARQGMVFPICGPDMYGLTAVTKKLPAETRHAARHLRQYDLVEISAFDGKGNIAEGAEIRKAASMRPGGGT